MAAEKEEEEVEVEKENYRSWRKKRRHQERGIHKPGRRRSIGTREKEEKYNSCREKAYGVGRRRYIGAGDMFKS